MRQRRRLLVIESRRVKRLSYPYIVWMAIFVIVPLLIVCYYGFSDRDGNFTLEYVKSIASPVHWKALLLSVKLSLISTLICFLLSLPLAMVIRGLRLNSSGFIIFIFILPMWMNFLLRTIAWQSLLEKTGIINTILHAVGLPGQSLINTEGAIILGMVYNYLPFMVLPIYNSLAYHITPDISGYRERYHDGICAGHDYLCHLQPSRWR